MHRQRGITLSGLLLVAIAIVFLGAAALKIMPDVIDYMTVVRHIKELARDPALRDANVAAIRNSFDRRLQIDSISDISGSDLDIKKQGSDISISIAFTRKISLLRNVSLVIDFEGSSDK